MCVKERERQKEGAERERRKGGSVYGSAHSSGCVEGVCIVYSTSVCVREREGERERGREGDIVWWSEDRSELWLFELTISFESVVADARERKRSKYYDLVEAGRSAGFRCELITLEVGSRGMLSAADLEPLQAAIEVTRKEMDDLCLTIIRTTVLESFRIWGSRNCSI